MNEPDLLIKGVSKTIKNETKDKQEVFSECRDSLLGIDTIREGEDS